MISVRLQFPLRYAPAFDWEDEADFNQRIQTELLAAHHEIMESTPEHDSRPRIEKELLRLRKQPLARRQQMLRYYLLAQCSRARDLSLSANFGQALEWCARAEEIAMSLVDLGAQVDLHELRGTLHRAISLFWIAAEEFSYALRLMREHAGDEESFDPEFEVTLAAKTAIMDFFLGNFSRALDHVQRAQSLLPLLAESHSALGTVAWTYALLDRQRNELLSAAQFAEIAVMHYRQIGASNSTCRVLSLAADIALDAAESSIGQRPPARAEYLEQALGYIDEALRIGREAHDDPGIALATLSLARAQRLQGALTLPDAEKIIRAVLRQARSMRDDALAVAAQTTLGMELLAFDKPARAKRWLTAAVDTAEGIQAPGLAFRAQRGLRQIEKRNA